MYVHCMYVHCMYVRCKYLHCMYTVSMYTVCTLYTVVYIISNADALTPDNISYEKEGRAD